MYEFIQSTGEFLHDWQEFAHGYSGFEQGKNNPDMQEVHDVGPLPCGTWRIGKPYHHPKLGPETMDLTPIDGTNTFGRSDFRIHGDSTDPKEFGQASHGCVILNRIVRKSIADNLEHDDLLRVVARPDEVLSVPVSD